MNAVATCTHCGPIFIDARHILQRPFQYEKNNLKWDLLAKNKTVDRQVISTLKMVAGLEKKYIFYSQLTK